jgi:hypothetical protein
MLEPPHCLHPLLMHAVVLADARAATLLAHPFYAVVLADAAPTAFLFEEF